MKATLEFNLPEDDADFKLASAAVEMHSALFEIRSELRRFLKYGHTFKTPDEALEYMQQFVADETASLPEVG